MKNETFITFTFLSIKKCRRKHKKSGIKFAFCENTIALRRPRIIKNFVHNIYRLNFYIRQALFFEYWEVLETYPVQCHSSSLGAAPSNFTTDQLYKLGSVRISVKNEIHTNNFYYQLLYGCSPWTIPCIFIRKD